jgi:trehalose/maltose transport system substrate-binding protein
MQRLTQTVLQAAVSAAIFAVASAAQAASIKISCSGVGQELEFCKGAAEAWAKKTGNEIQIVTPPNDASERLALYQQVLSAGSDKIDVLQVDVVWPGLLGNHLLDLKPYTKGVEKDHFAGFIANNTNNNRLVAMPWFANAGLLFYRKDLLQKYGQKVPDTWDELGASAKKIQDGERAAGNDKMWGYVWQGRAYEGLTCDALEWVVSFGGGTIVENNGKVSIKNPNAAKALQTAASWVGSISPTAVLNYAEEEARGVFQAGNAVYMRNWP